MLADAAARQDEILWLLEHGYSEHALAEDLGVARVVVQKAAARRGNASPATDGAERIGP